MVTRDPAPALCVQVTVTAGGLRLRTAAARPGHCHSVTVTDGSEPGVPARIRPRRTADGNLEPVTVTPAGPPVDGLTSLA
jgi:hypothetical protein